MNRVHFCVPFFGRPFPQTLAALGDSAGPIKDAGWEISTDIQYNNPYISNARNQMLRAALDRKADAIVFMDHDVSWDPLDLLKLIETPGDVVAGTYRFKQKDVEYMGAVLPDIHGNPQVREVGKIHDPWDPNFDDAIVGFCAPAGFLKITPNCVDRFMEAYPQLVYGPRHAPSVDLFNHGVYDRVWYGEDYAFCRNWRNAGGELLLLPNLNISHWLREENGEYTEFKGNYHWYLASCAGGAMDPLKEKGNAEHETDRGSVRRSAA